MREWLKQYLLSTHQQAAAHEKAALELSKAFCFACLGIEALKLGIHVAMREGNSCVDERADLKSGKVSHQQRPWNVR